MVSTSCRKSATRVSTSTKRYVSWGPPASSVLSTNSRAIEAGRSTTSPAAILADQRVGEFTDGAAGGKDALHRGILGAAGWAASLDSLIYPV